MLFSATLVTFFEAGLLELICGRGHEIFTDGSFLVVVFCESEGFVNDPESCVVSEIAL